MDVSRRVVREEEVRVKRVTLEWTVEPCGRAPAGTPCMVAIEYTNGVVRVIGNNEDGFARAWERAAKLAVEDRSAWEEAVEDGSVAVLPR